MILARHRARLDRPGVQGDLPSRCSDVTLVELPSAGIRLDAVVGGNEVSNPFIVTEVYVRTGSISSTRLLAQ